MQPAPTRTQQSQPVYPEVVKELTANGVLATARIFHHLKGRRELGIQKYGQELHTFDQRDSRLDLQEELLDALQYLTKMKMEGKVSSSTFQSIFTSLTRAYLELNEG